MQIEEGSGRKWDGEMVEVSAAERDVLIFSDEKPYFYKPQNGIAGSRAKATEQSGFFAHQVLLLSPHQSISGRVECAWQGQREEVATATVCPAREGGGGEEGGVEGGKKSSPFSLCSQGRMQQAALCRRRTRERRKR